MLILKGIKNIYFFKKFPIYSFGFRTAQEEPAILNKPVIVPRDFTERPQSYKYNCSIKLDVNNINKSWKNSINWLEIFK